MILKDWDNLPEEFQNDTVRQYYDILKKKKSGLVLKRAFDILMSAALLVILAPFLLVLAVVIKIDSKGPVFYRQVRVTQYGKTFRIFKFRSMISDAELKGNSVTVKNDNRVTRVGKFIRKYRIDELGQLLDIFRGTMSFVGTRPEIPKYVECYSPEMLATLLLPAGVTSRASIYYKDEAEILDNALDVDKAYIEKILPEKMKYNLKDLKEFSFWKDIKTIFATVIAVLKYE